MHCRCKFAQKVTLCKRPFYYMCILALCLILLQKSYFTKANWLKNVCQKAGNPVSKLQKEPTPAPPWISLKTCP